MTGVMFVHGFTGTPSAWDEVRAELTIDIAAHAAVLAGHGPHGDRDSAHSLEQEADRLAEVARQRLDRPRVICAYSLGARVAFTALARHPELFDEAILIGVHPGLANAWERTARQLEDEARAARLEEIGLDAFIDEWAAQPLLAATQQALPPRLRADERARRLSHTAAGLALSLRAHGLGRMNPPDPAAVRARVTLVAGSLDPKFVALAHALAPRLAHARVVVVEGAGHNIPLERPDVVARALEDTCR